MRPSKCGSENEGCQDINAKREILGIFSFNPISTETYTQLFAVQVLLSVPETLVEFSPVIFCVEFWVEFIRGVAVVV